jgi:hypothetical protein
MSATAASLPARASRAPRRQATSMLAAIALTVGVAGGSAYVGRELAAPGGADLVAARAAGMAHGTRAGAARGRAKGFAAGTAVGRRRAYRVAYRRAERPAAAQTAR